MATSGGGPLDADLGRGEVGPWKLSVASKIRFGSIMLVTNSRAAANLRARK